MKRLRALVRLGWQLAAIGVITFGLAEVTVRACRYFAPSLLPSIIFYDQSYNRYRGRAGALDYGFRLNSAGFKDVEFTETKAAGTYRVVALGDSFAFGVVPYEHNYLTLLEQRLNDSGRRTEVINMGIPGIGPQDYLAVLANEGVRLKPDMVLVSFFVGNDFAETMRLRTRLHQFSDFLALIKYVVDSHTKFAGQQIHVNPQYDDNAPYFSEGTFIKVAAERSWIFRRPPTYEQAFSDAVNYLVQIKDLCTRNNIALSVAIIPDEIQVTPDLQTRVLDALSLRPNDLDFTGPGRFLTGQLQQHDIDAIDLLPGFANKAGQLRLYKPLDTHWNIAGNKLAAELLEQHLAKRFSLGAGTK